MPSPRRDKPTNVRLSPADLARADRLAVALVKRHAVAGLPPPSRHAVLVLAVRAGLDVLERKAKRPPP